MFKKKTVKPHKKPMETFVEEPQGKPETFNPPHIEEKAALCECGKPVHLDSNQCWACAHRA